MPRLLTRAAGVLRARFLLRRCELGRRVGAHHPIRVVAEGRIAIGDRVSFWPGWIGTDLVCHAGAELVIGEDTQFNYGSSFESWTSVRIGARCMFGSLVRIADRGARREGPIVIEDDVWIAHGAVVEPGVTIGRRSVVAANSVVTADVGPDLLAAGNPARCAPLRKG